MPNLTNESLLIKRHRHGVMLCSSELDNPASLSLSALMNLPCLVFLNNMDSYLMLLNEEVAALHNVESPVQGIGGSLFDICPRHVAHQLITTQQHVMKTQTLSIQDQTLHIQKNDQILEIVTLYLPWYQEDQQVCGVLGICLFVGQHPTGYILSVLQKAALLNYIPETVYSEMHHPPLTPQEKRCLQSLLSGQSTKAIAKQLQLSPRTVDHYLEKIRLKYKAHSRVELIAKLKHPIDI